MFGERFAVRVLNALIPRPVPTSMPGLLLGCHADQQASDVTLPLPRRFEHVMVLGKSGAGKTHFLEHVALQHFVRDEGCVLLDFHGDATQHMLGFATRFLQAADRVVLVDLTDPDRSPGLNPLELKNAGEAAGFRQAAELAAILKRRWGTDAFGARTEELLRNTLYTLAMTGYTLVEAPTLLTSAVFRRALIKRLKNADVVAYWQQRYEPLSEPMKAVFREPLLNKITGFLTDPIPRHLLGQTRSTIRFADAMREGRWVLVNLAKGRLGEHAHTLGNLIFARLQFEVLARVSLPQAQRQLFSILCDEVQNLAENDLVTLLAEGRKFGVSLVTANQFWHQLPTELRGALLSAGTHVLFRLSAADARVLAPEWSVSGSRRYVAQLTTLSQGTALVRSGWA